MSMTKEEAILLSAYTDVLLVPDFSDVHKFCEDTLGRPIWTHEFADQDVQKEIREKLRPQIMELVQNISALRPITREQVEKVWKGEWIIPTIIGGRAYNIPHCSACNGVPCGTDEHTRFCAHCGAPMTDKAVDMVMERMEKLKNEIG